jgi:hypothetical protein
MRHKLTDAQCDQLARMHAVTPSPTVRALVRSAFGLGVNIDVLQAKHPEVKDGDNKRGSSKSQG